MKIKNHPFLFTVLLCLLGSLNVHAQTETDSTILIWRIETTDENIYVGKILERNEERVQLQTQTLGTINIPMRTIRRMTVLNPEQIINGVYWPENRLANRYFLIGSAYGLKKGEAYYRNSWIFFNQFDVGLSDNFSLGGGLIPLFLFAGAPTPVWVNPKVSIPIKKDRFNLGVGGLVGGVIGADTDGPFGFFTGVATIGKPDAHFSVGAGYAFAAGEISPSPAISFGGMQRIGKKGYIVTENYLILGEGAGLISLGGRSIWNKIALDYGGFIPVGDLGELTIIPWLGITLPLGSEKSMLPPYPRN